MPKWNALTERHLSRLTRRLKRRRVELFVRALNLGSDDLILDLGSEDGSYLGTYYPYPGNIVLADILEGPMKAGVERYGLKDYIVVPEDGPIPASNREYDAVWCNSVVEHVTVRRSELPFLTTAEFRERADQHQRRFAREIARVGRRYFVQTPYLHFPIESHSWIPCVQYLPHQQHVLVSRVLKTIWVKQWTADFRDYIAACAEQYDRLWRAGGGYVWASIPDEDERGGLDSDSADAAPDPHRCQLLGGGGPKFRGTP